MDANKIECRQCKYLMFSDCYGECSKGNISGAVKPHFSCGKGVARNNHHILRHNQRFNYPTCTDAFTEFLVLLPCHVIKEILILWVRY